jgi:hypothetical protein
VDGGSFLAVRPLFAALYEPERDRLLREFVWPLAMIKRFRGETYWRCLTGFGHDFDNTATGSRNRHVVLPVLFFGRDADDKAYFAVFPVGGRIREFLGRDEITFVLFPLYTHSSYSDVSAHDVLWPLISWAHGSDMRRFRFFPFYGRSVNEGRWTKQFVMWPVWTSASYDYDGGKGDGFLLFPFVGRSRTAKSESWTVLPPLFKWSTGDGMSELNCPWPFVQYRSGDIDKLYIWPLWGRRSGAGVDSSFLLWPVGSREVIDRGSSVVRRVRILPLIHYESITEKVEVQDPEDERKKDVELVSSRYFKLWPLMSYRREDDVARVRMLDLWPLKNTPAIERNLAPFWTLYSRVRSDECSEDELLWGLFRRRRDSAGSRHLSVFPLFSLGSSSFGETSLDASVLLGLMGYKREGLRRTYRLLYFIRWTSAAP